MDIKQAKQELRQTIRAYTARTEDGLWRIPREKQRPVLLMGPPGIGKTAILSQLAQEEHVGLVCYTMTHHTRQSALGLPQIVRRSFGGAETAVTEYTMSEIVAGVYRYMEQTGRTRGILFLDEINCVSETLLPAVMELLQHKRFGEHRVPEGWSIVCAGNPEKFNRSARAFDPAAMDRVRVLRVEPELDAWLEYAAETGVQPVIRSYLRLSPEEFCRIEPDGAITPRSWTDLSRMLSAMEALGEEPDEALFEQYLQCPEICARFALYEKMCRGAAGRIDLSAVLAGDFASARELAERPFEEALFAAELLAQRLSDEAAQADSAREQAVRLDQFADGARRSGGEIDRACGEQLARRERALEVRKNAGGLTMDDERRERALLDRIRACMGEAAARGDFAAALDELVARERRSAKAQCRAAAQAAENGLRFMEQAFPRRVQIVMLSELLHCERAARLLRRELPERMDALEEMLNPERRK